MINKRNWKANIYLKSVHQLREWEYEKYEIPWNMDEFEKANFCWESVNQTSVGRAWTLNLLGEW